MGLNYNTKVVEDEIKQFIDKNSGISPEAVEKKRSELICRETLYAIWIDNHARFGKDGKSAAKYEAELRSGNISTALSSAISYFNKKASPDKERFLESFQKITEASEDGKFFADFEKQNYQILAPATIDHTKNAAVLGDDYVKGLFAPVTDSSGMVFDGFSGNKIVSLEMLRNAETKTNSIKIQPPEGMSDELATYVVMGEFFKDEHLNGLSDELKAGGSTLPDSFSTAENTVTTFFENTIRSETRTNMQACRLIVPKVRQAAKDIIESGDKEAITANLKNAFDVMYTKAASGSDADSIRFAFSVRHATKLVEAMRANGIDLKSAGISDEKLDTLAHMKKTVDFVIDTGKLHNDLIRKGEEYLFSGLGKENDVAENKEIEAQLYELAARNDVINAITKSVRGYHNMYDLAAGAFDADDMMASRGVTDKEHKLMTDEEGMLNEAREFVRGGESKANFESKMATPADRLYMTVRGIVEVYRHEAKASLPDFIEKGQNVLLDYLTEYANANPGTEKLQRAIQNVRTAAASVRPDSSWQEKDTLLEPYKALAKETNALSKKYNGKERSLGRETLKFLSVKTNLSDLIKLIEQNPDYLKAQDEHERKRAQFHESVKNDQLKFDHDKVKERLDAYKLANPNATAEQLLKAEVDITADEARIYTRLSAYERCMPDGRDLRSFTNIEQQVRQGIGPFSPECNAMNFFEGKDKLRFITAYQKNFAKANDQAGYENIDKCLFILGNTPPGAQTKRVETVGDGMYKALFAPKTDRSQIRMTGIVRSGDVTEELVGRWQDEADSIEIPVPKNIDASLVEFMVLGRTMQSDLLREASEHLLAGFGSSMPENYDIESNVKVNVFDNLTRNDERGNTHCIRSVVPQARREVRDLIMQGGEEQLKSYIKASFDSMYVQMINLNDHNSHTWLGTMRHMGRLLEGLENSGITPQSIGIDPARVEKYNKLRSAYEMIRETARVQDEIHSNAFKFFESGFAPEYDPTGNTQMRRLIEKREILVQAKTYMHDEIFNYKDSFYWMQLDRSDTVFAERDLFPSEKMCAEDPEAYKEFIGRQVKQNVEDRINSAKGLEKDKMSLADGESRTDINYIIDQEYTEKNSTGIQLEEARAVLAKPLFDEAPNIENARRELDELIEYRNGLGELTADKIQTLAKPYSKLHETLESVLKGMPPKMLLTSDVQTIDKLSGALERSVERIGNEPERIQRAERYEREYAQIKQGLRPAFMDRYEAYRGTLESLGTEGEHLNEFNAIKSSMDTLNRKLNTLCSDRNTILTRSDAKVLRQLYVKALKSTADFINVSGKKPLGDDKTFMATEIQSLLARELKLFDKLPQSNSITMSDAIAERYGAPVRAEDAAARFSALADKLDEVGSRFGGNSREFDNMKKALGEFRKDGIDRKKLKELSEALAESAEKYITAKKTVPGTEKGKRRLQLAREARELCGELKQAYNYENYGARQTDNRSFTEKLNSQLKKREDAAYNGIRTSVQTQNREMFKEKLSEMLYIKDVQKKLRTVGEEAAELLKPEKQQLGIDKLKSKFELLTDVVSAKELGSILSAPDAGQRTGPKNADRSDNLIVSKRPQLGF